MSWGEGTARWNIAKCLTFTAQRHIQEVFFGMTPPPSCALQSFFSASTLIYAHICMFLFAPCNLSFIVTRQRSLLCFRQWYYPDACVTLKGALDFFWRQTLSCSFWTPSKSICIRWTGNETIQPSVSKIVYCTFNPSLQSLWPFPYDVMLGVGSSIE